MNNNILLRRTARKKFLARARSDSQFEGQIEQTIENRNTHAFGDVSSVVGTTILGHNADCQSLDLEMWSAGIFSPQVSVLGPAQLFREDIKHKILENDLIEMQSSYEKLNAYMIRCIPPETGARINPDDTLTANPRAIIRDPSTMASLTPHDYRYAGDTSSFITFSNSKERVREIIDNEFGKNVELIDYIYPVKILAAQHDVSINTIIDDKPVSLDIKGYTLQQNES